jgi:hypothetical protein
MICGATSPQRACTVPQIPLVVFRHPPRRGTNGPQERYANILRMAANKVTAVHAKPFSL